MALIPTKKISQLTAYNQALQGNELFELEVVNLSRNVPARAFVLPSDALITHQNMSGALPGSRMLAAGVGIALTDVAGTIRVDSTGAVAGPANPTALVGLAAVNGAAITYMRSDAAPALDQSISPLWIGLHRFAQTVRFEEPALGSVLFTSVLPEAVWNETDAAANNRAWSIRAEGEQLLHGVRTDAGAFVSYMIVDRTAQVVDSVNFTSVLLQVNGTSVRDATNLFTSGTVPAARLPSTFSGLANPTAAVGLVAVNGVATTAMRSDAAPPLDQTIAPTWTGQHTYTLSGATNAAIILSSAQPQHDWNETDAAANNRRWRIEVNGEQLLYRVVNDANSAAVTYQTVDRTLNVVDSVNFTSTVLQINGTDVRDATNLFNAGTVPAARLPGSFAGFANPTASLGLTAVNGAATTAMRSDAAPALSVAIVPTWTGVHTFSVVGTTAAPAVRISSTFPNLQFNETDGAANNRNWQITVNSEQMLFRVVDDAGSAAVDWMTVDRTLNVIDKVAFPATSAASFQIGPNLTGTPNNLAGRMVNIQSLGAVSAIGVQVNNIGSDGLDIHSTPTVGDNGFIGFYTEASATVRGGIDYNRAGGVVRYNTTSDARRKRNIRNSPDASGNIIDSISVRQFDWRDSGAHLDYWFVAQEVHPIYPLAVSVGDDEGRSWGIDVSTFVPLLFKEVQSLRARVARLDSPVR